MIYSFKEEKIAVSAENIAEGIAGDCAKCPIALAIAQKFPDALQVDVGAIHISFFLENKRWWGHLPNEAATFVSEFDHGKRVKPFEFWIRFEIRNRHDFE